MLFEMEVEGIKIPYCQYALNETQVINVIPVHTEIAANIQADGFETMHWGKLSELNFIMECQTRNSLTLDNWDFRRFPDPEIVILSKIHS